jgi:hypothetical protein
MKSYLTCRPLSTLNKGEKHTKLLQLNLLPLFTNYYLHKKIAFFTVGIYLFSPVFIYGNGVGTGHCPSGILSRGGI